MPPLTAAAAAVVITIIITFTTLALTQDHNQSICIGNGLHPGYDTDCEEYYRCFEGKITQRLKCQSGQVFSVEVRRCVRRNTVAACVRVNCSPGDSGAYAVPGTSCTGYYRCHNGTVCRHTCHTGTWFDVERGSCAAGPGTCYDPLCTGLTDGNYPDVSHHCQREYMCRGGHVVGVQTSHDCDQLCPPARETSVSTPVGDDVLGGAGCDGHAPGPRGLDCARWVECGSAGDVLNRGRCDPGTRWNQQSARCEPGDCDFEDKCGDGVDVTHVRDRWDCAAIVLCHKGRVVGWGRCKNGTLFNGEDCLPPSEMLCSEPAAPSPECASRFEGEKYADVKSGCRRYFRCKGGVRTVSSCPIGKRFADEAGQCVRGKMWCGQSVCEIGKTRGGCRGYYWDCAGERTFHKCPPGTRFSSPLNRCVVSGTHQTLPFCPEDNGSCRKLDDGFYYNNSAGCSEYYYCDNGDRIFTTTCPNNFVFNGERCVSPDLFTCPTGDPNQQEDGVCLKNGFFVVPNTKCVHFYFCIDGVKTKLTCPKDQVFNGKVCSHKSGFTCRV